MVTETMSVSDVCKLPNPRDVIFPVRRSFNDHSLFCKKLNAVPTVIDSEAKRKKLAATFDRMLPGEELNYSMRVLSSPK